MTNHNKNDRPASLSRRKLMKNAGLVGAAVAGSAAQPAVLAADRQSESVTGSPPPVREALEILTAREAETLEAITNRILPSDENGPGAREARAVHYIDRSLASDNAASREDYSIGLAALDQHAAQTHGQAFHRLPEDTQDQILEQVIAGDVSGFRPVGAGFFNMVRDHTIEGTFSDPYYGGNRDFTGWDLLRYPGVRVGATESDVAKGSELAPAHQSAYDFPAFTKSFPVSGGNRNGN